jgi:hypothetical protein
MNYGLSKDGSIKDSDWFWTEVKLRAMNNYGDWDNNKFQAEFRVKEAIADIAQDNSVSVSKMSAHEHNTKILEIVKDMIENK